MAANLDLDPLNHFPNLRGSPIFPVDPADINNVWALQEELKKRLAPNETFQADINYYRRVCGRGADVGAVWYRLAMFELALYTRVFRSMGMS